MTNGKKLEISLFSNFEIRLVFGFINNRSKKVAICFNFGIFKVIKSNLEFNVTKKTVKEFRIANQKLQKLFENGGIDSRTF